MKSGIVLLGMVCAGLLVMTDTAGAESQSRIGAGARYHVEHSVFTEVPYSGDMSYGAVYEYHEGSAYWQLGLQYAPDLDAEGVDSVLTPEINLLFTDGFWRGGTGALVSYVETPLESSWSKVYWQFLLGIEIPLGGLNLDVMACYVFEDWNSLGDFAFEDIEGGVWLTYAF
jgi:hypothetical protein